MTNRPKPRCAASLHFLRRTKPPASPYRPDSAAVNRGHALYVKLCAQCHAATGARTLTVIPLEEVQTDRHRIDMWTTAARDAYNNYRTGYDWNFSHFQKVEGYVAETLDGLWLRAPYLHNGSVPTLADLLEVPQDRPKAFVRGGEVLDSSRGGFVAPLVRSDPPGERRFLFRHHPTRQRQFRPRLWDRSDGSRIRPISSPIF